MTIDVVAGAVLCGGASTRMGRDKTTLPVGGTILAARAAQALAATGIDEVVCVGGDSVTLEAAGLATTVDRWPGEGPLGGILTAFDRFPGAGIVVVLAGDLSSPDPRAIEATIAALSAEDDLAAPSLDGRVQWLHAAWRTTTAEPVLAAAFSAGERSIHRAASGLRIGAVDGVDPVVLADIDTPSDLRSSAEPVARELP